MLEKKGLGSRRRGEDKNSERVRGEGSKKGAEMRRGDDDNRVGRGEIREESSGEKWVQIMKG